MTLEPPICAVAVIDAAPEAVTLAGDKVTEATPEALVSAVPPVGVIVPMAASVENVTTVLGTAAPEVSVSVALTIAGAALLIVVTAVPVESTSEILTAPVVPVVVLLATGVSAVELVVGTASPPQPAANRSANDRRAIDARDLFKQMVFTETPQICSPVSPYCEIV